jgi:hypothetical protein
VADDSKIKPYVRDLMELGQRSNLEGLKQVLEKIDREEKAEPEPASPVRVQKSKNPADALGGRQRTG